MAFIANIDAAEDGVMKWGAENALVLFMIPTSAAPLLFMRNTVVQIVFPILLLAESLLFLVYFYPTLH
jgi:hypothetical protein